MSENGPSKIPGALQEKMSDGGSGKASTDSQIELQLLVNARPGRVSDVEAAIRNSGGKVRSANGGYVAADVPAGKVKNVAENASVRRIQERRNPEAHAVDDKYVSEGLDAVGADILQDSDITGDGARIAVIDGYFHTENPKYEDQIVGKVGDSTYFTTDIEYNNLSYSGPTKQHGTACAEIVSDIAPDAELVLATVFGRNTFGEIMDEIEQTHDPDAATMSLGYYIGQRIDGEDYYSARIDEFTDGGRLFAVSAGNEAGDHWDGPFSNDGKDLMEFDSSLSTPTRYPVLMDPVKSTAVVIVHWDADWSQDSQRYEARLYESESSDTPIVTERTTNPVEEVALSPDQHSGDIQYYLEIERIDATGNEQFDLFTWNRAALDGPTTPERSIGIPATSSDDRLCSVAAVQATSAGATKEEYLKSYSSQGPTQDGRRGIDVAAPSVVSTTAVGDAGGYGALQNGRRFGGTSAASPHLGGAFGLLFGNQVDATPDEVLSDVFDAGQAIEDPDVSAPDTENTKIGFGYLDALGATDVLSVAANGAETSQGGQATINVSASNAEQVTIQQLWTDWNLADEDSDGGSSILNIGSEGTYTVSWGSIQDSVAPSIAVELPGSTYAGGTYRITVSGTNGSKSKEDTADIQIK